MKFDEACCEVDFILEHLQPSDKEKIPKSVFDFFKENKSIFYKVNLTTEKLLKEQKLKDETKAFLQIINYKYFADEKQKESFEKMLESNNETKEEVKEEVTQPEVKEIVVYKENKLVKILRKIRDFFIRKTH